MEDTKQTVLIIEDEEMILDMYSTKFRNSGFTVEKARDGKEGLSKILNVKTPDLVILDVVLPKKSGFSVLKTVQQQPKLKKVPIIVLTNLGSQEDHNSCKKLGAREYLIKSNFTPGEVVERARSVLAT